MTDELDPSRPWFLLCEGTGDVNFFTRLFEARAPDVGAKFSIRSPI